MSALQSGKSSTILPLNETSTSFPTRERVVYTYDDAYYYLVSMSQTTTDRVQIGLLLVNFVVGISANSGVLAVILSNKKLRSVPNMLMVAMIVSDILFLLNMPVKMVILSSFGWVLPGILCKPYHWSLAFCKTCSIWIFALLARDRWKVIVYPMQFYQYYSAKSTVIGISIVYTMAAFLSLFEANSAQLERQSVNITELNNFEFHYSVCLPKRSLLAAVSTIVWQFCIPFLIISCFYIHISITLFQLNKKTIIKNGQTINMGILQQVEKRKRLGMTVLVLVVIFVVCNLPLMSCHVLFSMQETVQQVPISLWYVANNLSYYNSTINPMVLLLMSSSLRKCIAKQRDQFMKKLREILGLDKNRGRNHGHQNSSTRSAKCTVGQKYSVRMARNLNCQIPCTSNSCSSRLPPYGVEMERYNDFQMVDRNCKLAEKGTAAVFSCEETVPHANLKMAPIVESSI